MRPRQRPQERPAAQHVHVLSDDRVLILRSALPAAAAQVLGREQRGLHAFDLFQWSAQSCDDILGRYAAFRQRLQAQCQTAAIDRAPAVRHPYLRADGGHRGVAPVTRGCDPGYRKLPGRPCAIAARDTQHRDGRAQDQAVALLPSIRATASSPSSRPPVRCSRNVGGCAGRTSAESCPLWMSASAAKKRWSRPA